MLVLLYEGDPADPMSQFIRVVRASSLNVAREKYPHAAMVQKYHPKNYRKKLHLGDVVKLWDLVNGG